MKTDRSRAVTFRQFALVSAAAVALAGSAVLPGSAQAMPDMPRAAMKLDRPSELTNVRYDEGGYHHGYRHHRHHERYGYNAHPRHPGHAGVYDCGPGGKNTRLSRKACGGNDRFQHMRGY